MSPLIVVSFFLVVIVAAFVAYRVLNRNPPSDSLNLPEVSRTEPVCHAPVVPPRPSADLSSFLPPQFVVLDLETTGLSPYSDEIIEIGAVKATLNSETHATFQQLVKPSRKIPKRITEITGITQKMIETEGLPVKEVLVDFFAFVGDLPVVSFNAEFDIGFLCHAAVREGLPFGNSYTCALKKARRAWPGLPSYKLIDLARMGNLTVADSHRALGDSVRALMVFTAATSVLRQKVRWSKPKVIEMAAAGAAQDIPH
jgi:DNA polymerase III epsilon subunit family exonuclease